VRSAGSGVRNPASLYFGVKGKGVKVQGARLSRGLRGTAFKVVIMGSDRKHKTPQPRERRPCLHSVE
jgi:hypothetical protein